MPHRYEENLAEQRPWLLAAVEDALLRGACRLWRAFRGGRVVMMAGRTDDPICSPDGSHQYASFVYFVDHDAISWRVLPTSIELAADSTLAAARAQHLWQGWTLCQGGDPEWACAAPAPPRGPVAAMLPAPDPAAATLAPEHECRRLANELSREREQTRSELAGWLHAGPVSEVVLAARELLALERGLVRIPSMSPELIAGHVAVARVALDVAHEHLRDVVFRVRMPERPAASLPDAIRELADAWGRREGFEAKVDVAARPSIELDALLFDIVRELVINAARHASPHHVRVTVAVEQTHVRVVVSDDGRGLDNYDPRVARAAGCIGLAQLETVVEACGGSLAIDSPTGGHGTVVEALVPHDFAR